LIYITADGDDACTTSQSAPCLVADIMEVFLLKASKDIISIIYSERDLL
jgi:hypothetical protein